MFRRTKKTLSGLVLFAFLICGCSSMNIRTVVIEPEEENAGVYAGSSYDLEDLIPSGMTIQSMECFDSQGRVIGLFSKGTYSCIMAFDIEKKVGQQLFLTRDNIKEVLPGRSDGEIIYMITGNSESSVYALDIGDASPKLLCVLPTGNGLLGVGGGTLYAVYCDEKDRIKLDIIEKDDSFSRYDITDTIDSSLDEKYLKELEFTDISVNGSGRLAVLADVGGRCFLWTGVATGDVLDNSVIMECEGDRFFCTQQAVYYINTSGDLMRMDPEKREESAVVDNVDHFSVSADDRMVAYSRLSGTSVKLYTRVKGHSGDTVIDIRQEIESFMLNDDGSKLIVGYYDKSTDAANTIGAKYSVLELIF